MNISLTRELEAFVTEEVKTGLYQSASEVIRAGLRRLKEEKERKSRFVVSSMPELEEKFRAGIPQVDRGEGVPGEVAFARLRQRARARTAKIG